MPFFIHKLFPKYSFKVLKNNTTFAAVFYDLINMAKMSKQPGAKDSNPLLTNLMLEGIDAYLGLKDGIQCFNDYSKAFRCFNEAARLGDENAAWLVGRAYLRMLTKLS